MKVKIKSIEELNSNVRTFWLVTEKPFDYTAGQYIEMYLPHDNPDERGQKHWFTLSSSPTEEQVSITTKFAEPSSTFKQALSSLKPGDEIDISEPMGDFVLPIDPTIPLVFVAGGIGITPLRSMVKYLVDKNEKRPLQVILAANSMEDFVFLDVFDAYGIKPQLVVSNPPDNWTGETGHLSGEVILKLIGDSNAKRIYVSGPEQMVETIEKDLDKLGLDKTQFVGDFFPGYPPN